LTHCHPGQVRNAKFSGSSLNFRGVNFARGGASFFGAEFSGGTANFGASGDWSFPPRFSWTGMPPPGVTPADAWTP
jgi:hypothetical protein